VSLNVKPDRHLAHATQETERHLLLRLTAPKARRRKGEPAPQRPGVNVCFVLDRSGSMAGPKLALARHAVDRALLGLTSRDRFAIVVYDDHINLLVKSTTATDAAKAKARIALQAVDARGSTALHEGWARGAEAVKTHLDRDGVNRVLLLTDGLANRGVTDPTALKAFAADLRASGVATSTFGVGANFDEALLQGIADAGGGHFYYIERPEQIPDYMTGELGELLETVAREVVISAKHVPAVALEALSPVVAQVGDSGELRILVGDLVAGQDVELVLRARIFPPGAVDATTSVFFTVADRDGVLKADGCTVEFRSATDDAVAAEVADVEVVKAVARLRAAQAREAAVLANRAGNFAVAKRTLSQAYAMVAPFQDDEQMRDLGETLRVEEHALSQASSETYRKTVHFAAVTSSRSRDASGKARRMPDVR
jgi:Ca-activated chloride channel family protein